jgi:ABC-type multidrug transport system ATPase subunit
VDAAVSVRELARRFGRVDAVRSLSFDVQPGELFGVVGPDGAGKTTTLRMLAGVLRPTAGDALVRGVSVVRDPEGVKTHIAYMSQRFGLYTDLTVQENLDFYADLYRVPRGERAARYERLYRFSALGQFTDRLAGQLSGGMKQKLGLSCALVHEPEILLLDEPTFGVDPISRRDLWIIVHDMVAHGMTTIVSTAYLDEAERCDRVALLHEGRVLALDTPPALQRRAGTFVIHVRTERPRAARDVLRRMAEVRQAAVFGDDVHVMLADPERDGSLVRRALEGAGIAVLQEARAEPSLEDVFIALVTGPVADA